MLACMSSGLRETLEICLNDFRNLRGLKASQCVKPIKTNGYLNNRQLMEHTELHKTESEEPGAAGNQVKVQWMYT